MPERFAEYEKARLVRKLREARERRGKLGGRKPYAITKPATVERAKALRQDGKSWAQIAAALFAEGHATARGKPYVRSAVRTMVEAG